MFVVFKKNDFLFVWTQGIWNVSVPNIFEAAKVCEDLFILF